MAGSLILLVLVVVVALWMVGAYNALVSWINANGYHINGPGRELYLQYERGGDQSKYVTELQFPVERV